MARRSQDEYEMAHRAFNLFTLEERESTLNVFSRLRYPSLRDRFFEAVHRVIVRKPAASPASERE